MISLNAQRPQKKNWMLPSLLCLLYATFSACAHHGPDVSVCVVDSQNAGFQCSSKKTHSFVSFLAEESLDEVHRLTCVSPHDLEHVIKACKQHQGYVVTGCQLKSEVFMCLRPGGSVFSLRPDQAENYACLSLQDTNRLLERCK